MSTTTTTIKEIIKEQGFTAYPFIIGSITNCTPTFDIPDTNNGGLFQFRIIGKCLYPINASSQQALQNNLTITKKNIKK